MKSSALFTFLCVLLLSVGVASAALGDNLLRHYSFNDENDLGADEQNGADATGAATYVEDGRVNGAAYFGTNPSDGFEFDATEALAFNESESWALGFWVLQPSTELESNFGPAFYYLSDDGSVNNNPFLSIEYDCPGACFYSTLLHYEPIYNNEPPFELTGYDTVQTAFEIGNGYTALNDDEWHHVLFSYDATTKTGYLYYDGAEVDSLQNPSLVGNWTQAVANTYGWVIGNSFSGNQPALATMDDFCIWGRHVEQSDVAVLATGNVECDGTVIGGGPAPVNVSVTPPGLGGGRIVARSTTTDVPVVDTPVNEPVENRGLWFIIRDFVRGLFR